MEVKVDADVEVNVNVKVNVDAEVPVDLYRLLRHNKGRAACRCKGEFNIYEEVGTKEQ